MLDTSIQETVDLTPINFEVTRKPVYGARQKENKFFGTSETVYEEIDNKFEFFRKDNGLSLGLHSGSYRHNGYQSHIASVLETVNEMSRLNLLDLDNKKTSFNVYEGGRKLKLDILFPRHNIEPAIGDITSLRLRDWDSYDGSWGRRVVMDGLRLWCLNGCTSPAFKLGFYAKHTKSLSSDEKINQMIGSMETMLTAFNEDEDKFKKWIATPITHEEGIQMFSKTLAWAPKAVKVNEEYFNHSMNTMELLGDCLIDNQRSMGRNLYAVYNTATQWASHVGETRGQVHNVERSRETKVAAMLNSEPWGKLERVTV